MSSRKKDVFFKDTEAQMIADGIELSYDTAGFYIKSKTDDKDNRQDVQPMEFDTCIGSDIAYSRHSIADTLKNQIQFDFERVLKMYSQLETSTGYKHSEIKRELLEINYKNQKRDNLLNSLQNDTNCTTPSN